MPLKRIVSFFLLIFLFTTSVCGAEPKIGAQGAALIDGDTGRLLWGKNENEPLTMASTTKIMTAILVLERGNLEDIIEISKNAASQPEVHMELRAGEKWRVGDLLSAMMLRSYNDTAVALAEYISDSVEEFCNEMTEKATEIGAKDTIFASPNGLDSQLPFEKHHSTARDMALIGAYALKNEKFCEIISQQEIFISDTEGKKSRSVTNADRFLREYNGAMGIKTGYTNKAGHCFVGAAERDGIRLVSAVLAAGWGDQGKERKWTDTKAIMDYGFDTFHFHTVIKAGDAAGGVTALHSKNETVDIIYGKGYSGLFSADERKNIKIISDIPAQKEAPVKKGDIIGRAQIISEGEILAEIPIEAAETAERYDLGDWLQYLGVNWVSWF